MGRNQEIYLKLEDIIIDRVRSIREKMDIYNINRNLSFHLQNNPPYPLNLIESVKARNRWR